MQHTKKYRLNLIETSDTFSPAPLNENMEKVEAQFDAEAAARGADVAALDQRLGLIEARRLVMGTYTGDGTYHRTIPLGFTPQAVYVHDNRNNGGDALALPGLPAMGSTVNYLELEIVEGGFKTYGQYLNVANKIFYYIAIL